MPEIRRRGRGARRGPAQPGSAERLAAEAGALDVLVNNAGDMPAGGLAAIDEAKWRHAWELKVFGFINLTRAVLAGMESRGRGAIVNVIGMAGVGHPADYIAGAAGNAALEGFTKGVGKGSVRKGVRVVGYTRERRAPSGSSCRCGSRRSSASATSRAGPSCCVASRSRSRSRSPTPWCSWPRSARAISPASC
jgi:hypothetical protein